MSALRAAGELYLRLLNGWNERDAQAWGDLFTDDGTIVGFDGSPVASRASIVAHLRSIFADHEPAAYVALVEEVRELAPGSVLLRGAAGMVPPGDSDVKPELNTIQVLVAAEGPHGWRIAHFQSTPAAFHGRPEAVEALTGELRAVRAADRVVATP